MIELRTPAEIEAMRPAGRFVAGVLERLASEVRVGVDLLDLDGIAHRMIRDAGAESCYIDYHPSFDFAASVDGWVADSAITVVAGTPRSADLRLIDTTQEALAAAIAIAKPGFKLGDISAAIGSVCHAAGYSVNLEFGGHGVGRTMHGDPHVPNDGRAGRGLKLRPGLVIAIEPWLLETDRIRTDLDGWTLRSIDGSRGAHSEHTVVVTDGDPLVLTARG